MRTTVHEASRCTILCSCLLISKSPAQIPHQHPILEYPRPIFFLELENPSFKRTSNKRRNYNSVCFNLKNFSEQTRKHKKVMVSGIPLNLIFC